MNDTLENTFLLLALAVALSCGLFFSQAAMAEPGGRHMGHGFGPHHLFKALHSLDLDREQRTRIGAIMDRQRPIMREFMFDMKDSRDALEAIVANPDYDEAKIKSIAAAQAANAEKMYLATARSIADISAVLTPAQRETLAQRLQERPSPWDGKRRHGGEPH